MQDIIKKIALILYALVLVASLHGQTTTYGDTIFFENFGQHTARVRCIYMPTGSYTFADANGTDQEKAIDDNFYAVVDPTHIADARALNYFWTSTDPNTITPNGARYYTTDHTRNTNGAVMVVNAGTTVNYIYKRDTVLRAGFRYLFSFYIYVVNRSSQFSMKAINNNNGITTTFVGPVIGDEGRWIKYDLNFSVRKSKTDSLNKVTLGLQNEFKLVAGNDYYIDDILLTTLHTDPLSIKISNDGPVCVGGSVNLKIESLGDAVPFTYEWKGPNGFTSTEQSPIVNNFTPEMAGTYTMTATDALGQEATASTEVIVNPVPNSDFRLSTNTIDNRHNTVSFDMTPEKKVTYIWNFGDATSFETQTSPTHTFTISGSTTEFIVSLTATDSIGCTNTTTKTIEVTPFVPNVFSPNGDGVNDVFMKGYDIQILDRNGLELYIGVNGWDGIYQGKQVDTDTYFYLVYYTDKNKQVQSKKGYITLVR